MHKLERKFGTWFVLWSISTIKCIINQYKCFESLDDAEKWADRVSSKSCNHVTIIRSDVCSWEGGKKTSGFPHEPKAGEMTWKKKRPQAG